MLPHRLIHSIHHMQLFSQLKMMPFIPKPFSVPGKPWAEPGAVWSMEERTWCTEVCAPHQHPQRGAVTQQTPNGAPQRTGVTKYLWQV